jgi:hypothetical protein
VERRRDLAELQIEVDETDALPCLRRQVAGQVRGIERLAAAPTGRSPLEADTSAMSKARLRAAASCRLLVGYSTRSTAPVRTMSLRLALGFGPSASTMDGTAPAARTVARRAMPAWLSKTGPATSTSNGPCSSTSSTTTPTLALVTTS